MKFYSVTEVLSPYWNTKGKIPQNRIDDAIVRGNETHHFCTETGKGEWVPKPLLYEGYCDSFLWYFERCVEEVILVEQRLEDPTLGYFGHPDFLLRTKGNRWPNIIDLKTPATKSKLWPMQISAYHNLAMKNGYLKLDIGGSLRLRQDGGPPKFDEYQFQQMDFAAFLSALNVYRYLNGG